MFYTCVIIEVICNFRKCVPVLASIKSMGSEKRLLFNEHGVCGGLPRCIYVLVTLCPRVMARVVERLCERGMSYS